MKEIKIVRRFEYAEGTFTRDKLDEEGWKIVQVVPVRIEHIEYEYILEREKP